MHRTLDDYILFISRYINKDISVYDFEKGYLEMVKTEKTFFNAPENTIIQSLFGDVDAFCDNPEIANYDINDPFRDIDEEELNKRANEALQNLKML